MRVSAFALAAFFAVAPALADGPPRLKEASASAGFFATAVSYQNGRSGDALLQVAGDARVAVWRLAVAEVFGHGAFALASGHMGSATSFGVRGGYESRRLSILAGPLFIVAPGSPSVDKLPSLTVRAGTERWKVVFGLLDRWGTVPARLGVETNRFGVSLLALYGLEGWTRFPLGRDLHLDVRAFGYQLFGLGSAGVSAGLAWTPEAT